MAAYNPSSFILYKWLSLCIAIVGSSSVIAQDFKAALLKMRTMYAEAPALHVIMSIGAFDSASPSTVFYNQKAEVKKEGSNYYYEFDGMEMLLNEKCLLMINHKQKQILFTKNNTSASGQFKNSFQFNLDSMLTAYGKAAYLGNEDGMDSYRITHRKDGAIKQTEMSFSVASGQIEKINYWYTGGQQVVIQFELFDKNPIFPAMTFSELEYITLEIDQVSLVKKWKNYRLINGEKAQPFDN